jgi:hypothetical protein
VIVLCHRALQIIEQLTGGMDAPHNPFVGIAAGRFHFSVPGVVAMLVTPKAEDEDPA